MDDSGFIKCYNQSGEKIPAFSLVQIYQLYPSWDCYVITKPGADNAQGTIITDAEDIEPNQVAYISTKPLKILNYAGNALSVGNTIGTLRNTWTGQMGNSGYTIVLYVPQSTNQVIVEKSAGAPPMPQFVVCMSVNNSGTVQVKLADYGGGVHGEEFEAYRGGGGTTV